MKFFIVFLFLTFVVCAISLENKNGQKKSNLTVAVVKVKKNMTNAQVKPRKNFGGRRPKRSDPKSPSALPILLKYPKTKQCFLHKRGIKATPLSINCKNHGIIGDYYFAVENSGCFLMRQNSKTPALISKCDTPTFKAGYYYHTVFKKCLPQWKKQAFPGPTRKDCDKTSKKQRSIRNIQQTNVQQTKLILIQNEQGCTLLNLINEHQESASCDGYDIDSSYFHRTNGDKCEYVDKDKSRKPTDPHNCDDKYYKARFVYKNGKCQPIWKYNDGPSSYANGYKTLEHCQNDKVGLVKLYLCNDHYQLVNYVVDLPCPKMFTLCQEQHREAANKLANDHRYQSLFRNYTYLNCIMGSNFQFEECFEADEGLNAICPVELLDKYIKPILHYVATLNDCLDQHKKHYTEVDFNDCEKNFANCKSVNDQDFKRIKLIAYEGLSRSQMFACQKNTCIRKPRYDTYCARSNMKQFLQKLYPSSMVAFYNFCYRNDVSIAKIVEKCPVGTPCQNYPFHQIKRIVNFHTYVKEAERNNSQLTPLICTDRDSCEIANESSDTPITFYCYGEMVEHLTRINLVKYYVCAYNSNILRYKEVKSCGGYINCKKYTRKEAQQILTRENTNFDKMEYVYCDSRDCTGVGVNKYNANAVCQLSPGSAAYDYNAV